LDIGIFPQQLSLDSNPTTKLQPTDAEMGQNWYRKSYDYLDGKGKYVLLDDLDGVSQDDESDAYTRQDGRGATVGEKVSGEAMNDADMSAIAHVEETKLAREIVLENKVEFLEAKVKKLQLEHDKMAEFFENFKVSCRSWLRRGRHCSFVVDSLIRYIYLRGRNQNEDPSDAAIDGEHMDAVGHPDEKEGPNEKEDPSDAAIDGEHMDAVGHPDENEGPNAKEDSSDAAINGEHMDTIDVLMTDAPGTINLADPPSHESEITSLCSSEKKGDKLDGAKANQEDVPASQNTIKVEVIKDGAWLEIMQSSITSYSRSGDLTRDSKATKTRIHVSKEVLDFFNQVQKAGYRFPWGTGFTIDEICWQCLVAKEANRKGWLNDSVYIPLNIKNAHWFLAEFQIRTGVVTFYDTLSGLESWQKENLDWWLSLRVMMIEQLPLANGLSMDFPPGPIQTALAYREKMTSYFWKYKITC
ncbi:phospholipase-like protein, partial [Tanacetum coccineum]